MLSRANALVCLIVAVHQTVSQAIGRSKCYLCFPVDQVEIFDIAVVVFGEQIHIFAIMATMSMQASTIS